MKEKNDFIELQETRQSEKTSPCPTKEDNRKILPQEVKNLKFILSNCSKITKYTWENDGEKIISSNKLFFTREEKKILKYLLLQELPEKYRPNVNI